MSCADWIARVVLHVIATHGNAMLLAIRVLALLPHPNELLIMTAATALIHWQLRTST